MTNVQAASAPIAAPKPLAIRIGAAVAGACAVALAAQVSIPVPGTPVPMTLQPLAVLVVAGLLGPRFGALSMVMYLAMGAAGLPVFTPFGAPGAARLFGPTGGFLLAYPVAAAVVGRVTGYEVRGSRAVSRIPYAVAVLAALSGTAVIFAGGLAQLTIISGAQAALALGALPFIVKDLANLVVAGLLIRRFGPSTRALT
jgi:biotin transport system substrate-specific component